MNVLTNLMALLTPKTAKDAAQTAAPGQAGGGADFAALMQMPTPDAAIVAMPGAAASVAPAALPIIGDGVAEATPDTDVAGALPLPQQTAAVLAQQVAVPVAGAKAIRNATVAADPKPAGGKALPLVDGDAAGDEGTVERGEGEGAASVALPVPGVVADTQAAAIMTSAIAPVSTPVPAPAPLPRQDKGSAPVEGIATVAGPASHAIASTGSVNIADINKSADASGAIPVAAAMPLAHIQPGAEAVATVDPKPAGKAVAADIAPRGRDGKAKTGTESVGAASLLPSPVTQSTVVAEAVAPVAMPSRLAGRASVTAARAEAPDMPVASSAAPVQPAAPVAAEAMTAIPQAIVQAVGGQPATVVAQAAGQTATQAAAQGAPATEIPSTETDAPVIGEATALLRMAAGVPAGKRAATPAVPAYDMPKASAKAETAPQTTEARIADLPVSADRPAQPVHAMQASIASAFPAIPAETQPVTDLSATLGQQVIDMSSGGQWIDGLAKEIATLASGTGQGSFRLSPEHLGPMRVDIRHGDLGAEISLTVQTAAAESALRQDSDKLKADAQLSAVRVHEVRVERVHNVAETARSDGAGNQNSGNNGGASSWNQGGTQTAFSQSQGQSNGSAQANAQGQGNGHQGSRKVSGGDAVLNHAGPSDQRVDDAQDGVRRARYA